VLDDVALVSYPSSRGLRSKWVLFVFTCLALLYTNNAEIASQVSIIAKHM